MNEEIKLEYQELKSEFAFLSQMIGTIVNASVGACVVVFSLVFPKIEPQNSFFLFWLPLLIIYPACLLVASRVRATHRIAAYIIVFLESNSNLKHETRLMKLKENKNLHFRRIVLLIFAALILFDIAIFISKGYSRPIDSLCYVVSVLLFLLIYRWMHTGWTRLYVERWSEIKEEEERLSKPNDITH